MSDDKMADVVSLDDYRALKKQCGTRLFKTQPVVICSLPKDHDGAHENGGGWVWGLDEDFVEDGNDDYHH